MGRITFSVTILKYFQYVISLKKLQSTQKAALYIILINAYFLFKKSFTKSGLITDSTNIYAPVFGDLTIFMALVNLLDPVCNDATAFFAMAYTF